MTQRQQPPSPSAITCVTSASDGYIDVREPGSGHLLFRYNAGRDLIEIVRRGVRTVIDLAWYRSERAPQDKQDAIQG